MPLHILKLSKIKGVSCCEEVKGKPGNHIVIWILQIPPRSLGHNIWCYADFAGLIRFHIELVYHLLSLYIYENYEEISAMNLSVVLPCEHTCAYVHPSPAKCSFGICLLVHIDSDFGQEESCFARIVIVALSPCEVQNCHPELLWEVSTREQKLSGHNVYGYSGY